MMGTENPTFTIGEEQDKIEQEANDDGRNNGPISRVNSSTTEDVDLTCGYGRLRPRWLQKLHNSKCLLVCLSLCTITQGMIINGLVPVSITTLEKRFHLTSTQSGLFSSMYDIAVLLVLIPVCHFGNKSHKGKWLGWGMFMFGLGSLVCAVPQFAAGSYEYGSGDLGDICRLGASAPSNCSASGSQLRNFLAVLLLGQLLHGFGASPLYTLGITYIDENVSQRASPIYLGFYIAFSTIGPAFGFILGGFFLKIYGDVEKANMTQVNADLRLGSDDPRWYGAWWIGFLLTAAMAITFSIPVLSFARKLPGAARLRLKDINQANQFSDTAAADKPGFGESVKDIPKSCWLLLKNPTYTAVVVMQTSEAFLLNGFVTFVPKLMENVFALSSSSASLITGGIVVPGGFIGNVLGGYIIRRFNLLCRQTILLALSCQIIVFLLTFVFMAQCDEVAFAGINRSYKNLSSWSWSEAGVSAECNSGCGCSKIYHPVCHLGSKTTFYSPCFAGCSFGNSNNESELWTNCQCLESSPGAEEVVPGVCATPCTSFPVFVVLFAAIVLITFTASMPVQQIQLRCVQYKQRTMALGFSWIFIRALGSVPGAILFGLAIDKTCVLWKELCGVQQSCLRYSSRQFAFTIMGFGLAMKAINAVSLLFAWLFYRAPIESSSQAQLAQSSAKVGPSQSDVEVMRF